MFVLTVLFALTLIGVPAFSKQLNKHIPGFHEVKTLPLNMVAGGTYEWEVSFVNPKSENGLMSVTLEITEENGVGPGEFSVEGKLESYVKPREHGCLTLIFAEENEGGIFQNQTAIEQRFNHITLTIWSVPNLMPGTYTFTLTVIVTYN